MEIETETVLILIDAESKTITLYGEKRIAIPFANAFVIQSLLADKNVLYISQLQQTTGEDMVNMLADIISPADMSQEKLYISCNKEGYLRIPEIKLTLGGPRDAKPIEKYGWDLFERSPKLRQMFMNGEIEIIPETEANNRKKTKILANLKDKALDDLILDRKVDDVMGDDNMFGPDGDGNEEEINESNAKDILSEAEEILQNNPNFGKDRQKK